MTVTIHRSHNEHRHQLLTLSIILAVLAVGMFAGGCAASAGHNAVQIACAKPRAQALNEAKLYLQRLGFVEKTFLPDSGYYRTKALEAQNVAQALSGKGMWYVFEVRSNDQMLSIRPVSLIADPRSDAALHNRSPEDDARTEEEPILPGNRYYTLVVQPFIEHMTEYCGK